MILANLVRYLRTKTELTDKVGDRMYVNRAPGGAATPYLILSRVSGDPQYDLSGENGTAETVIQISAWALDPNGPYIAEQVAAIVRDKLSGYRGEWDGLTVRGCTLNGEPTELSDQPDDQSDNWLHGVTQDYRVTHAQAVPALN